MSKDIMLKIIECKMNTNKFMLSSLDTNQQKNKLVIGIN